MNVVLYMRYSSEKQSEQSIEGQDRVCTEYCNRKGYTIVGKYIDRATSAFHDVNKRVEFLRMIKESKDKIFEKVVVYKLDRFARSRDDATTYKAILRRNGVRVESATELITDRPESIIMESVLEGMAEYYSAELSEKVKRGMHESALKCQANGGIIPYGYAVKDKKYIVEPYESEIVKEVFRRYSYGELISSIVRDLNERGLRNRDGKPFTTKTFQNALKNRKYLGIYKYGDVEVQDGMPRLVDDETFERVAENISRKQAGYSRAKVDYVLSGKLFCGLCGTQMIGDSAYSHGKMYNYYTCKEHRRGSCELAPIKKEPIEDAVVRDTMELLTPELIDELSVLVVKEYNSQFNNSLVGRLERELEDVRKRIAGLVDAVVKSPSRILADKVAELELIQEDLEDRLRYEKALSKVELHEDDVRAWLSAFISGDIDDIEFRKKLVRILIAKVVVFGDHLEIFYNLGTGRSQSSVRMVESKDGVRLFLDSAHHSFHIRIIGCLLCVEKEHHF